MPAQLPAQKRDPVTGVVHVDYRAVAALALPLMANSSLQAVISLTDTWFIGHISTAAMAGMAAVYWVILLFLMLIGGVGLAVQTFVAQAEGSRRRSRASHATWVAMWASVLTLPFYAGLAWLGGPLLAPFGLPARGPGTGAGVLAAAHVGRANGRDALGHSRVLQRNFTAAHHGHDDRAGRLVNGVLNWVFIFKLDGASPVRPGPPTSAWVAACCSRSAFSCVPTCASSIKSHLTWRPEMRSLVRQYRLGLPMGRDVRGRPLRSRAVSVDAGAAEPGRGCGDPDRDDADVAGLYAGHGYRTGGYDTRGPGDRCGRSGLGAQGGQCSDPAHGGPHGRDRCGAGDRRSVDPADFHRCG